MDSNNYFALLQEYFLLITSLFSHAMLYNMNHESIINWAEAERIAGSREAAQTFLTLYMKELPISWEAIHSAFNDDNHQMLQDELHKLLGATRYCSLPELQMMIESFDSDLKAGKHDATKRHIHSLQQAIDTLEKAYHEQR